MHRKSSTPQAAVQPVSSPAQAPAPGPRVSPLRERMLALMAERGFAEATRAAYVRGVLGLVARCGGRGPEARSRWTRRGHTSRTRALQPPLVSLPSSRERQALVDLFPLNASIACTHAKK